MIMPVVVISRCETMQAKIHWQNDKNVIDDSEPLTGTVVSDSEGLLTIKDDGQEVFHRVERTDDGTKIVRSLLTKGQRKRDTRIKGVVTNVVIE